MFEIMIDDDILMDSVRGNYTCGMYCLTSHGVFPGENWVDFAGILIFEWVDAIISACRFEDAHFKLLFMDGPYEIVGHREYDKVRLDFYRNGNRSRVLEQTENIEIHELAKAMYKAVVRLKKALFLKGYGDAEDKMGRLKEELKLALNQLDRDNELTSLRVKK